MRLLLGASEEDAMERRQFADWVLSIGDGFVGMPNDDFNILDILMELLINSISDPIDAIVEEVYPDFVDVANHMQYYQNRAILSPKNDMVDQINNYMASKIQCEEMVYYSLDTPHSDSADNDRVDNVHSSEYLNTITSPGLPNRLLKLKVGLPVMLLRNIDQNVGLCNGTRMIITRLSKHVLEAKVISRTNIGYKFYILRLSLIPSNVRIPFKFQRRQFPITISFAMAINKSQGQSLQLVGVYLPTPVFSHGQLYVSFSRVTTKHGLKMLLVDEEGDPTSTTNNVVYHEIFTNLR